MTTTNYQEQANDFAAKYGITLKVGTPTWKDHWNDGTHRWVFPCILIRNNKRYSFPFGQSIADGKKQPTMYDILACMTKNDPESFEFFCDNYGYEKFGLASGKRNKQSHKTYLAVKKEYEAMTRLFDTDILEEMQEIN